MKGETRRVLHLTSSFPRSKEDHVAPFLLDLARAQVAAGMEVAVLAPHAPGLPVEEDLDGVRVRRFRYAPSRLERLAYRGGILQAARSPLGALLVPPFLVCFALAAVREALRFRPEVVHAHWWIPGGLAGLLASRLLGVPLVVQVHGSDLVLAERWPLRSLARWVLQRAAVVGAVSRHLADRARGLLGKAGPRVELLPMPLGVEVEERTPLPPAPPVRLLAAGRFVPVKGFLVLIRAFRRAVEEGLDGFLELVGEGPEGARLAEEAAGLGERVRLRPPLSKDALRDAMLRSHAVVVPSLEEGLGLVAAEALALGRPVVASRVGGLPEVVEEGRDGVLAPPGDVEALKNALMRLPLPPPEGRALARHLPEAALRAHLAAYREALMLGVGRWRAWRVVGGVAGLGVLLGLVGLFRGEWGRVRSAWSGADPVLAVLAGAALVLGEAGFGLSSGLALRAFRGRVAAREAAGVFYISQTAKHIPGGIWPVAARWGAGRAAWGLSRMDLLFWLGLEAGLSVLVGGGLGCVLLGIGARGASPGLLPRSGWLVLGGLALGLPFMLAGLARAPGRLLGGRIGVLAGLRVLPALLAYLLTWALRGAGVGLLGIALGARAAALPVLAGAEAVSSVVGFLVLPVPAGVGVREGVFVLLVGGTLGPGVALSISLASRFLIVLAGFLLAAVGPVLVRGGGRGPWGRPGVTGGRGSSPVSWRRYGRA